MSEPLEMQSDDLEINLTGVSLAPPLLAPGSYPFIVKSAVKKENKQGTGYNFVVEFELTSDAVSEKNVAAGNYEERDIPAGRTLTKWFPLQQSENPKAPDFRADIIRFYMAVFNCAQADVPTFSTNREGVVGAPIVLTVKTGLPSGGFAASNEITKMAPAV